MIGSDEARVVALRSLANDECDRAVTRIEDTGEAGRVFCDNRIFVQTRAARQALAGNLPLLVDKKSGTVVVDEAWQP